VAGTCRGNEYQYNVKNICILIKFALSFINIHRNVSVAFETIISVFYKDTGSIYNYLKCISKTT